MNKIKFFMILLIIVGVMPLTNASFDFSYLKITMLNQDPDPAVQGDYVELRWKIQKLGNEKLENLSFTLNVNYPFSFDGSDNPTKNIGDWKGYSESEEFYTLYYKLRVDDDALEGSYNMSLTSKHKGVSYQKIGDYNIRIGDKEKADFAIGTIQTDPIKLVSDIDEAKINIQIENIGDGNAENTKVLLAIPSGFSSSYSYSDRVNIGTLEAGGSETATFYFDIPKNVIGKSYDSNLTIEYKEANDDDNKIKKVILPFEIPIKNKPEFKVTSISTSPESISPGDEVSVRIKVKNIGGEDGESVSLRVFKDSSQPFEFEEKSDYIGTLEPGESGEAIITLTVDQEANQKEYYFDIEIRSIYQGSVLVQEESMNLVVNPVLDSNKNSSPMVGIIIILIVIIIVLSGYLILKKKKDKK